MTRRERLEADNKEREIRAEMDTCIHFRGIQHEKCGAGIVVRELVGGEDLRLL